MASKYNIGDKVKLNGRVPQHCELDRTKKRTIVGIEYCPEMQATLYIIGSNGKGANRDGNPVDGYGSYAFRSYQLDKWNHTGRRGRPRTKRPYRHTMGYYRKRNMAERAAEIGRLDTRIKAATSSPEFWNASIYERELARG